MPPSETEEEEEEAAPVAEPVDPYIAAAENIIARLSKGEDYGPLGASYPAYLPPPAPVAPGVPVGQGPIPLGGPTEGPGMTQGGMMYDPTTGQYTSSTATQDLAKKQK
tara:strand:- start:149 stop:472 length:324 start_codon:yes stop_codon:yes gene_type:complete